MGADAASKRWLVAGLAFLATACAQVGSWMDEQVRGEPVALVFEPAADLPPPEHLRLTSNAERSIGLSWDPILVGDVAGYALERARTDEGPFELIGRTRSRFDTLYVDTGAEPGSLGDGQSYFYRVHAYDGGGRVSGRYASLEAQTEALPAPPSGLTVYSSLPRKAVVSWDPGPINVASYAIYRSPTAAGPYERVAQVQGRLQTLYEDAVPGDLRLMYYRVTALNRFGGESERSEPARAVTKAEPLPPIGLAVADNRIGAIDLRWEPNVESDLVAYEVWRSARRGAEWSDEERIGDVPVKRDIATDAKPEFRDGAIGCGQRVRYRLRVRDRDGLISDYSRALEVRGQDLALEIGADASGRAEIRWQAERADGWPRARIDLQRRLGLPPRTLGRVSGESRFTLPEDLGAQPRLIVTLERPDPDDESDGNVQEAPGCDIALQRRADDSGAAGSGLIPPLARVD